MENRILNEDIKNNSENIELLKEFNHKNIFVTGATGLIGSILTKTLLYYAEKNDVDINIYALVRNIDKSKKIFSDYLCEKLHLLVGDITKPIEIKEDIDYVFHLASTTSSKAFVDTPVEVISTTLFGAMNILEFAKEKNVDGFLFTSSLEVYGVPEENEDVVVFDEGKAGYIDPLDVRSSYSEGKRMAENICASYFDEYGVPVKIARLTQTFGPGIDYGDNRVFAEFARKAIEKEDIIIHSTGTTLRPYCYTSDAISAIIHIILRGKSGTAYNVANEKAAVSIKELAEIIAITSDNKIKVIIKNDVNSKMGYNPEMKIGLDTKRLMDMGWKPKYELNAMIKRLLNYMATVKG